MNRWIVTMHGKEFLKSRGNIAFAVIVIFLSGVIFPITSKGVLIVIPVLALSFVGQIVAEVFVGEKDNQTLETLISLPLSMKTIFLSKVAYACILCTLLNAISYLLGLGTSIVVGENISVSLTLLLANLFLVPISFYVFCFFAAYFSLKSKDGASCALLLMFAGMVFSIPAVFLLAFIQTNSYVLAACFGYLLLQGVIYILLNLFVRKYYDKTTIFEQLRD